MLEEDSTSLDGIPNIKAKGLVFLSGKGKDKKGLMLKEGIPVKDIVSAFTIHYTPENNTFSNLEKRSLDVLEVSFEPYGNGEDIGWWYGFLCRQKEVGVGLMPEYEMNGGFVSIVFRRATEKTMDEGVNRYVNGSVNGLSESLKQLYIVVCENQGLNTKQIAELLGRPVTTVKKQLTTLRKKALVEHRDSDKTGGYYPVGKK